MPPDAQTPSKRSHHWRIEPAHAYAVTAICWIGFGIVAWLVAHGQTARMDDMGLSFWRIKGGAGPVGPPILTELMRDITALGGVALRSLAVIGAAIALALLRHRREAALLCLTVVAGWIANSAMKAIFERARPNLVPHLTDAGGYSFPSGHSFNSAVVYISIALAFAALSGNRAFCISIIASAIALSLAVAWSRVWLGVHFPSDVIAGWLAGTGWAFLANSLFSRPVEVLAENEPEKSA
jgi:undecaprenyl-diphosphatase